MIVDFADKGITFVIITHDFEFAKGFGQRTIELSQHGAQSTQQPDLALLKFDFADKGITFVIITHDFEFAKGFGQRTIELSQHGAQSTQQPDLALLK